MQELTPPLLCLLVEDSPLVGLDLADALDGRGYYVAGPFPCGREAAKWLTRFTPDVAIVDLTLRDGRCLDVIRILKARAIPFLFYSGWPVDQRPFDVPSDVPWLMKPISTDSIDRALRELLSEAAPKADRYHVRVQQTNHVDPTQKQPSVEVARNVENSIFRPTTCGHKHG